MSEQRSLFRQRPRRHRPASTIQPPKLELGDPDSIAYARAQEQEIQRQEEVRRQEETRARISAAQRRRWQQAGDRYPPREEILAAIRDEILADHGIAPRRRRLEARVLEALGARQEITSARIRQVFTEALAQGLVQRAGRAYTWVAPEPRRGSTTASDLAAAIAKRTVLIRAGTVTAGLATLIVHGGELAMLTTQTAWDLLRDVEVEICVSRKTSITIEAALLTADVLEHRLPGTAGPLGPELAVVWLPRTLDGDLRRAGKVAHETTPTTPSLTLDRRHALGASPLGKTHPGEAGILERFHMQVRERFLDYLDVATTEPPVEGAGLWSAALHGDRRWSELLLEGVLYRRTGQGGRCHGMETIRSLLPPRARR